MTAKERVHAALNRKPVDRVPVFMWFHPDTAAILSQNLEIPAHRVAEAFGNDICQTWVGNNHAMEGIIHERDGEGHIDDWGVDWVKVGPFNQIRHAPLEKAGPDQIRNFDHPYHRIEALMANMNPVVEQADRCFIGCDISPCLFEMNCRLRGMENAAMDLAADPELAAHMLAKNEAFMIELSEIACRRFPLDWLWTGDDIAGQQGMIMSPACWRKLIKPRLKRIFDIGKKHHLWIAYHSCGAIRPIIPDLIDIGLDVLNPIQCNCPGMDAGQLKREYGKDLTFMGGLDTQNVLPNGSVDEVRRATGDLLETMTADGGGYILAASHTIPPETPLDNIYAMYDMAGIPREAIRDRAADMRRENTAS